MRKRVLVIGASGAIGSRLVPQLVDRGYEVIGTHTHRSSPDRVRKLGAQAVALDLLDSRAVRRLVMETEPDAIIHQATALGGKKFSRNFDRVFEVTNRLRTEGTDNLLSAAREAGVRKFIAQSFASMRYAREGGMVKSEDDPLEMNPPKSMRRAHAAMRHVDAVVSEAGGIVLRYGAFYGEANDGLLDVVRKRQYPIVGDGGGYVSFIHLDDAAAATVLALEYEGSGIFHVVDDDPAPVREWLPVMADALGAKPPRRIPRWLARLVGGELAVLMGTDSRAASNAKAKRELGWTPQYPSWRQGFYAAYAALRDQPAEPAQTAGRTRGAGSPAATR
jgi:nucleoside-diphosphate-sugar epimerase